MKRPYISISGTLDELILMEAILAYYYDEPHEEEWNNAVLSGDTSGVKSILCSPKVGIGYYGYPKGAYLRMHTKFFKASQLTQILKYIEEYEKI